MTDASIVDKHKAFISALENQIEGDVRYDEATCCAYSVDASIYELRPTVVVIPKHKYDVQKVVLLASNFEMPITARGAATGITGGCLGQGVILDLSRYMNDILEINLEDKFVICQPGVIQDQLNAALAPSGYRLGPDTSTGNRATIGGMFANNAAGAHSLLYGKMVDHVLGVELITYDGSIIDLKEISLETIKKLSEEDTFTGRLYKKINEIAHTYRKDILTHFPKLPRRVSGYNLDELVKPTAINLAKLLTGSEGTLGIATSIKLSISPLIGKSGLCVFHVTDMIKAMHALPDMLKFSPISLEMIDHRIIEAAKQHHLNKEKLHWLEGSPQAVFIAEFNHPQAEEKLIAFNDFIQKLNISYSCKILQDSKDIENVWSVRKAGLGLLLSKRTYSRAIAFLEDLSIPPAKLGDFMFKLQNYLKDHQKEAGIYGHVGAGCMHIRPYIDLRNSKDLELMHHMMLNISTLVAECGGALSGEHGDGLIRSWLNEKMFGQDLYRAFCDVKNAFDPGNIFNPGKIVNSGSFKENLRLSPETHSVDLATFLDFTPEGGFALAADLCNGNAQCRKADGLMCPSFQATRDEFDTTRARAQALRAVINGRWKVNDFTSEKVHRVMDLCLECKGCKAECPSNVDMAKMKAEFLFQYQEKHGYPFRTLFLGHVAAAYKHLFRFRKILNFLYQTKFFKSVMSLLGIAKERTLPLFAKEKLSSLIQTNSHATANRVVLFNDTFTEYNQPEIGVAAHRVLTMMGFEVIVPPWTCCGRPLISKGILKPARQAAHKLLDLLYPYALEGLPIIGLEPSCLLTLADDFPSIVDQQDRSRALILAKQCILFDEFIHQHSSKIPQTFLSDPAQINVKIHGHCHQKALIGIKSTMGVLGSIKGLKVSEIPSGCCGMAGSFGYEKEHYEISMKIGSLQLFPHINNSSKNTQIIANGFSCRHQIQHATGLKPLHFAELLSNLCKIK